MNFGPFHSTTSAKKNREKWTITIFLLFYFCTSRTHSLAWAEKGCVTVMVLRQMSCWFSPPSPCTTLCRQYCLTNKIELNWKIICVEEEMKKKWKVSAPHLVFSTSPQSWQHNTHLLNARDIQFSANWFTSSLCHSGRKFVISLLADKQKKQIGIKGDFMYVSAG